ncbi:uncharacterized protein BDR25DRAFT_85471 [Lindgomyces ingoldianus]|uniref:Uncharacterized protein n=1 Tax=Lindgomyces ingoldianus TaxID=673940 RepID=A0ACB6QHL7_9PLEO|nr:uncharacterized protein BDR25DRAFT_85471 [Lindgomyces ingoldianus]KAF2465607.1 hypothetical protein BDR25DRAFT_85471 [Lindgomyces ingoldianus]
MDSRALCHTHHESHVRDNFDQADLGVHGLIMGPGLCDCCALRAEQVGDALPSRGKVERRSKGSNILVVDITLMYGRCLDSAIYTAKKMTKEKGPPLCRGPANVRL